jgi:ADP-ribosylation factor-like protein 1
LFQCAGSVSNCIIILFRVWKLSFVLWRRPYWRSYYQEQESVIFVVDSCDGERMQIAKRELMNIVEEEELKNACICVFANKQDMPEALSTAEIAQQLGLDSIVDKKWTIIATSALQGTGLKEGFTWISEQLDERKT